MLQHFGVTALTRRASPLAVAPALSRRERALARRGFHLRKSLGSRMGLGLATISYLQNRAPLQLLDRRNE